MGGENIFRFERKRKTALVVGNEAHGISEEMKALSDVTLAIPMVKDGVESLNAAVAVGIAMYLIKKGDLLICEGGDTGRAAIWDRDDTIYYQNSIHRVRFDKEKMLPQYFLYILKLYKQQGVLNNYSSGQTIKHLVKKSLLSIPVPTPPIEIQHVFAQKLDIIKRNRHIIECSLRDAQQLLASRMDKYFSE